MTERPATPAASALPVAVPPLLDLVTGQLRALERRRARPLRVLSIGAPGSVTAWIAGRGHTVWDLEGDETTSGAGARLRPAHPRVRRVASRPEQLPWADASIDVALCLKRPMLAPGRDRLAVWELGRALAPDGRLLWGYAAAETGPAHPAPTPRDTFLAAALRQFTLSEPIPVRLAASVPAPPGAVERRDGDGQAPLTVRVLTRRPDARPPEAGDIAAAWLESERLPADAPLASRAPACDGVPGAPDAARHERVDPIELQRRAPAELTARSGLAGDDLETGWALRRLRRRLIRSPLATYRHYPPRPLRMPRSARQPPLGAAAPTISIVTPSYNAVRYIERTVRSVLAQRYPRLEYIVQDGGSTDGTRAVLERLRGQLARLESGADGGHADALNRGFRRATGEILAYLNADDLLLPGALAYVGHYFATHPDVDVVYGHRVIIDAADREVGRWVLPPHDDGALTWIDMVPQETLFWRRRIWERIGAAVDPALAFAVDWDLLLRFRAAGARFVRVPRFLGAFRVHEDQKSVRELESVGLAEMRRLRLREHGRAVSNAEVSRGARRYLLRQLVYDRLYRLGLLRY